LFGFSEIFEIIKMNVMDRPNMCLSAYALLRARNVYICNGEVDKCRCLDLETDPRRFKMHKRQGHCQGGVPKWGVLHFEGFTNGGVEFSTRKKTAKFGNKVVKMKSCHSPVHCWLDSLERLEETHSSEDPGYNNDQIDGLLRSLSSLEVTEVRERFVILNVVWLRINLLPKDQRRRFGNNLIKELLDCAVGLAELDALNKITITPWKGDSFPEMKFYLSYAVLISKGSSDDPIPLEALPISLEELTSDFGDAGIDCVLMKYRCLAGRNGSGLS
jgi:hypothetical protein